MLDVRKHALGPFRSPFLASTDLLTPANAVIVVAILFATYRLSRLEGERGRRAATVERDFDSAVTFLHRNLDSGKYQVLRIANTANKMHAMVVNRAFVIPHVEAELYVDQQLAVEQRKQQRKDRQYPPPVRLRLHDAEAMTPIAQALQKRNLIASYEHGHQRG